MEQVGDSSQSPKRHFRQPKTPHASIRKLLTIIAESQQATLQETGFLTYCSGLDGFLMQDLETATAELCLRERQDGRTSFPSLPTIVAETQKAANRRYVQVREDRDRQTRAYALAHPEKYCTLKEIESCIGRIQAKRAAGHHIPNPGDNATQEQYEAFARHGDA